MEKQQCPSFIEQSSTLNLFPPHPVSIRVSSEISPEHRLSLSNNALLRVYPQKVYSSISCLTTLWGEYQCCETHTHTHTLTHPCGGFIYTTTHIQTDILRLSIQRWRLFLLPLSHSTRWVTFSDSALWITGSQYNGEIISSMGGGN